MQERHENSPAPGSPGSRLPEFLYRLPDGRLLSVSADRGDYRYEAFRLFLGSGEDLQALPIRSVERRRDGGTTRIICAEGELCQPAPRKRQPATWNGAEVERLDPDACTTEENASHVTIRVRG